MPIINIQRRLREVGRIRLGEKVVGKNGKSYPSKIEKFRFTSPDEHAIQMVANEYGGEVTKWDGASVGVQWELYTDATELDVIVPPVDLAFDQWFEMWSGGGCVRRCDGENMVKPDKQPCVCDPDNLECKPTTRLGVILPAVDGIGRWRLESHGWAAASEIIGSIEVLRVVQSHGAMIPARLLLEQRQQKKITDGKAETFNFAVPVLDLKLPIGQLTGIAAGTTGATPIAQPDRPALSVAEQVEAIGSGKPRAKRANAAPDLPPTNVKPRTAKEATKDVTPGGASSGSVRKLFALLRGNKSIPEGDDGRHQWAGGALGHPVESFNDLSQDEVSKLIDIASAVPPAEPKEYSADDNERPF